MIENLEKYELSSFWNDGKKTHQKQHTYASTLKLTDSLIILCTHAYSCKQNMFLPCSAVTY